MRKAIIFAYYHPPMTQRRHRNRRYPTSSKERNARMRKLISVGVLAIALYVVGNKTLAFFGVGNPIRSTATVLNVENGGVVNVSVDGGPLKTAESELKLYAGDTVVSSPRNHATLSFFDGSSMRLDESTQVRIVKSLEGEESSRITVELEEGTVWASTPKLSVYSGSTIRTIITPYISAVIPSRAELVMKPRSVTVFSADRLGLELTIAGNTQKIMIGEGQQFTLPAGGENAPDLYAYRSPLDASELQLPFVEESRAAYASNKNAGGTGATIPTTVAQNDIALTIENPVDGSTIQSSSVEVNGTIGDKVERVRINGYLANINKTTGTFEQELVLPDEDEISITIEAVDAQGEVLGEAIRKVSRDRKPPEPPVISNPAGNGQTYLTTSSEIEISGTAPADAVGIEVNGYRLQLFSPGDTTWSYLANTQFNNFAVGENVFEVIAINRGGYRSDPAKITVILGDGQEGVVTGTSTGSVTPTTPQTVEEASLPSNAPLMPGTISIFAPNAGNQYTATESEFLIEGNIPPEVASVWVNGYQLRLYEKGKGFFNYIASVELGTLKRGRNVYRIATRDDVGKLLDEMDYVVTFTP